MRKPKVLILTANYGNGHVQVARTLEQKMVLMNKAEVAIRDLFQETNPRLHEWTKKLYLKSYTRGGRQLYRLFYYSSQKLTKRKQLSLLSYGYSKLSKIITEEQPDAIINTFPTFAVPHLLMKANYAIPSYNVVTDYCLHQSWIHPNISNYFVATNLLRLKLMENGVRGEKIHVSGIPVHYQFEKSYERDQLVKKYRLNTELKTVLVVAGAYGVSKEMKDICKGLIKNNSLQLIVVCGKNTQLLEELELFFQQERRIHIFGYVTEMAELFELATCIITKPGGIILSEALAKNVPIILPRATPGQENENSLYFQKAGAALSFDRWEELVEGTYQLVKDEAKLKKMKDALAAIYVPDSANFITDRVVETFQWQQKKSISMR